MIRTILLVILLALFFTLGLIPMLIMWVVHFFNKPLMDRIAFQCVRAVCKAATFLAGLKLDIKGIENMPKKGDAPTLYVLNHRTLFDIVIAYTFMKDVTGIVAKDSLGKIPLFRTWIKLAHGLFLNRSDVRAGMKTILQGIEYMKSGVSMFIFPEGTRNKDPESKSSMLEFHGGSLKLAEKSGAPILPISLYYTKEVFEEHLPFVKGMKVKVTFGEPIVINELPKEQKRFLGDYVQGIIQKQLLESEAEWMEEKAAKAK